MQLASAPCSFAKGFHTFDCKYAETNLLSWLRYGHYEFGNISQGIYGDCIIYSNEFDFLIFTVAENDFNILHVVQDLNV